MKKISLTLFLILVLSMTLSVAVLATDNNETNEPQFKNPVTITFDSGEGTAVAPIVIEAGTKITEPKAPTRQYYDFAGWYVLLGEEEEFEEAKKLAEEEKGDKQLTSKEIEKLVLSLSEVDDNDEAWSFIGYVATEDMTLVAKWVPNGEMPPMDFSFDDETMDNFSEALSIMGQGMIGIFVVTLVIIGVVAVLNWHGKSLERRKNNK